MRVLILLLCSFVLLGCSSAPESVTGHVVYVLNDSEKYSIDVQDPAEEPEPVVKEIIQEPPQTLRICADSDKGNIRWTTGTVRGFYQNATAFEFTDYCQNDNRMMEFYCEDENPKQESFFCRNGCESGACK